MAVKLFMSIATNQIAATSLVKYIYIFVQKNPTGRNDDLLCFLFCISTTTLTLLSQTIFQMLPGKNPYLFYICCNQDPRHQGKVKLNIPFQLSFAATFIIYVFVLIRIKLYKMKHLSETNDTALGKNLKSAMASIVGLALALATVAPAVMVSAFLNATDPEQLGNFPYYHLIQIHQHVIPFLATAMLTANSFVSNPKLRKTVLRQIQTISPKVNPVSVLPPVTIEMF